MPHTVILHGDSQRQYAHGLIDKAPQGYVVKVSESTRTTEQNNKMWAMLTDLSRQKPEGLCYTPNQFKGAIMDACGFDAEFVQGVDGRPFFCNGFQSSRLKVSQMADLIEFMYEYGARHGVVWTEPDRS